MVAYRRLKTKDNFKILVLKVVPVAYERWLVTRGSKYSDLTEKILAFRKIGRGGKITCSRSLRLRWSIMRGGDNRKFDCTHILTVSLLPNICLISHKCLITSLLSNFDERSYGWIFVPRVSIQERYKGRGGELICNTFFFYSQALRKTVKVVLCPMTTSSTMLRLMMNDKNGNTLPCTMKTNCSGEFTHFQWSPFLGETASTRKLCNFFIMV